MLEESFLRSARCRIVPLSIKGISFYLYILSKDLIKCYSCNLCQDKENDVRFFLVDRALNRDDVLDFLFFMATVVF